MGLLRLYLGIFTYSGEKLISKNVQKKTSLTTEVLEIIAVQKDISLSKMADQLSVSPKTVQRMMDVLKAEGRVVRKGGRRYGYWEILK